MSYNLDRFIKAQNLVYNSVIYELKSRRKYTHWMWYIFPQFDGLGYSHQTKFYAIKSLEEAKAYLEHTVLSKRLEECCNLLLDIENKSIEQILGYPDNLKLQSSMTLFNKVSNDKIFQDVLDKYFDGKEDIRTLELIEKEED